MWGIVLFLQTSGTYSEIWQLFYFRRKEKVKSERKKRKKKAGKVENIHRCPFFRCHISLFVVGISFCFFLLKAVCWTKTKSKSSLSAPWVRTQSNPVPFLHITRYIHFSFFPTQNLTPFFLLGLKLRSYIYDRASISLLDASNVTVLLIIVHCLFILPSSLKVRVLLWSDLVSLLC